MKRLGVMALGVLIMVAAASTAAGARIEVWQVGPDNRYDDAHRATLYSETRGRYRLEADFPPPYARRPSHVHILVDARGFQGLITQHYPVKGTSRARFDLVILPE